MTDRMVADKRPTTDQMKTTLQAYVDRMNAGDAAGVHALFAEDARIEDPVGTPVKTGHTVLRQWFEDSVTFRARLVPVAPIRGSHANAAALAFFVEFTPPDGPRTRIHSVDVCTFNADGQITELKAYWGPDDVETVE